MTIGIVGVCKSYYEYLEPWLNSINNLETQPDTVVIAVCDKDKVYEVTKSVRKDVELVQPDEPFGWGEFLNYGIDQCNTDWIGWVGLDDLYLPPAMNDLDSFGTDVVAHGMEYYVGGTRFEWIPESLSTALNANPIPCGSPFKRDLWEKIPFNPDMRPYEDWALWAGFAHLGATSRWSGRIDYAYRYHSDSATALEPHRTWIRDWIKSL